MYIPGSEEMVDVVKHLNISHLGTGIEPGTKGLLQRYEGGIVSYTVCNKNDTRTSLRALGSPHILILETPLMCAKTLYDILSVAYQFEVSSAALPPLSA